jgi:hypothetical protein
VFASLQKNSQRNVHKSLFLAREVIRVVACLNGRGIDVMPYKGVVMSEAYYGDLSLRLAGDMDFFVRQCDVARVKNFVRDLGYTLRLDIPHEAEQDYIASGYEYTFDSPAGKNLLELQWALLPRFYAVDFDMGGLFARAVNVSVAGSGVKTPAAEDLLLLLSVHAAKHVWGRLIWLCDIAQILRRENLNWDRHRADSAGDVATGQAAGRGGDSSSGLECDGSRSGSVEVRESDCRGDCLRDFAPNREPVVFSAADGASRTANRSAALSDAPGFYSRSGGVGGRAVAAGIISSVSRGPDGATGEKVRGNGVSMISGGRALCQRKPAERCSA